MKTLFRWLLVCGFLLSACASPTPALVATSTNVPIAETSATPLPPTATPVPAHASLQEITNEVDAHPLIAKDWTPAKPEMQLYAGGEVWAKEASTALVKLLLKEGVVRVAPNTIFSLEGQADKNVKIKMDSGQIWVNIDGLQPDESFEVETPTATAAVRGTRFSVRHDQASGETTLSVAKGTVKISTSAGEKTISDGQESSAKPGEIPSDPLPMDRKQQLLWTNAVGSKLETYLPATGEQVCPHEFQGSLTTAPIFDPNTNQVTYRYYDPSKTTYAAYFSTINLADCSATNKPPAFASSSTYDWSFSPDGKRLLFTRYDKGHKVCTADPNGENAACFTTGEKGDIYYGYPEWSPDGAKIIFNAEYYKKNESAVFVANADGSAIKRLPPLMGGYCTHGSWSPDGSKVAYICATPGFKDTKEAYMQQNELWLANPDGSGQVTLSTDITNMPELVWSPDGKWLMAPTGDGVVLFDPAGGPPQIVPDTVKSAYHPLWSPSSTGWPLTYLKQRSDSDQRDLYAINGPGQQPVLLLENVYSGPYWSPGGNYAMLVQREIVDMDKKIYLGRPVFIKLIPELWKK